MGPRDRFLSLEGQQALTEAAKEVLDRSNQSQVWPCLHSIAAWVNFPTKDEVEKSQLWHRDPEDRNW